MANLVNKLKRDFTQIPNDLINDVEISRDARFLFVYLMSKPDNWKYYVKTIEKELGCGKDSRTKYMRELINSGWITTDQFKKDNGTWGATKITLNPYPKKPATDPHTKKSAAVINGGGKNPPLNNTDLFSNTNNLNNTNKNGKQKSLPGAEEKKGKEFSFMVTECFKKCLGFFPLHLQPNEKAKEKWLDTIDKLNRIDGIPFEIIEEVVKWARNDKFWATNFLSILKLRKNDKNGVKYVIVFSEGMKKNQPKVLTPEAQTVARKKAVDFLNM